MSKFAVQLLQCLIKVVKWKKIGEFFETFIMQCLYFLNSPNKKKGILNSNTLIMKSKNIKKIPHRP